MAGPELNNEPVEVAPTPTVLMGPFDSFLIDQLVVRVENTDVSQSLDAWFEVTWRDSTVYDQWQDSYFMGIPPGEARQKAVDISSQPVFRMRGQASGAGLTALVSVRRIQRSPNR